MTDQTTGASERHKDRGAVGSPVQCPARPLIALLLACAASGCAPTGDAPPDYVPPKGWQAFVTPGNTYTYVIPVKLEDGTRCVLVAGNSGTSGRAITCDWTR